MYICLKDFGHVDDAIRDPERSQSSTYMISKYTIPLSKSRCWKAVALRRMEAVPEGTLSNATTFSK
jgi:hypothetical protein